MTIDQMIKYTNTRLLKARLVLSKAGEDSMRKRWKLSPDQGGFDNYWKEVEYVI